MRYVKCEQLRPRFELGSPCPFSYNGKHYTMNDIYIYIYIYIYIMSCYLHRFPRPSLAIRLYRPSLPTRHLGYVLYRHRANVDMFLLVVQHLLLHVKGSTGVHCLWVPPYSPPVSCISCSSNLDGFRDGW